MYDEGTAGGITSVAVFTWQFRDLLEIWLQRLQWLFLVFNDAEVSDFVLASGGMEWENSAGV